MTEAKGKRPRVPRELILERRRKAERALDAAMAEAKCSRCGGHGVVPDTPGMHPTEAGFGVVPCPACSDEDEPNEDPFVCPGCGGTECSPDGCKHGKRSG